jgi:hypothetical protein
MLRCFNLNFLVMKKIFALVLVALACGACQKSSKAPEPTVNSVSPHTVSTSSVYSGAFVAGNYTVVNSFGTATSSDVKVSFYTPPNANKMIGPGIQISDLRLNGKKLTFDENLKNYVEKDWDLSKEQFWWVKGNNSINSFNISIDAPIPSCTNFNVIPDSVSHSNGFTLNIPGVTNATPGARIIIYDGDYNEVTSKPVTNGDNAVSFSSSDFAYFGSQGFILIQLENNHAYNFYGQDFIFVKAKGFMKEVKFKL